MHGNVVWKCRLPRKTVLFILGVQPENATLNEGKWRERVVTTHIVLL